MNDPLLMVAAARRHAPVTVTEGAHTYPATLVFWHTSARHRGRARVILANGTDRTVPQSSVTLTRAAVTA